MVDSATGSLDETLEEIHQEIFFKYTTICHPWFYNATITGGRLYGDNDVWLEGLMSLRSNNKEKFLFTCIPFHLLMRKATSMNSAVAPYTPPWRSTSSNTFAYGSKSIPSGEEFMM